MSPASGSYFNSGTAVPITALFNPGFRFTGWTGPVANPSSAATSVNMTGPLTLVANFAGSCDVNGDGIVTVVDVQQVISQALGAVQGKSDVNGDGKVNAVDIQIVLNAAIWGTCSGD